MGGGEGLSQLSYTFSLEMNYVFALVLLRCRKLPKALKDWQAFNELKKKIDDFNETCPLLEMMTNKAMLERHWKRMEEVTSHTFDVESESFQLRNIMEAPILKFREDIEVNRDGQAEGVSMSLLLHRTSASVLSRRRILTAS